jgi:hypothetical protein
MALLVLCYYWLCLSVCLLPAWVTTAWVGSTMPRCFAWVIAKNTERLNLAGLPNGWSS